MRNTEERREAATAGKTLQSHMNLVFLKYENEYRELE